MNVKNAIEVNNLSKIYRLSEIGTGTISRDLHRWLSKIRGKEDPFLKIGEANDRTRKGESDIVYSLQDLNFKIQQGEAVGVIGRNGAGKSTLLKILSRVTSPSTGNVKIKGRIASLLEVGTGFHPELTGRENIYLNGAILGMRKKEINRKFDEIVDFSGVERYIDTPVKRYSSGMYVRLAFAVAAHLESEILIVDEVLAVGDVEFQKKCIGKIKAVSNNDGRTVLFVSHNMASIEFLTTKAVLLQNGTIDFIGEPRKAIQRYLEKISETTEVNLFDRTDTKTDGTITFTRAWVEDKNGMAVNEVMTGDDVSLCIEYKALNSNYLDFVQIALGIYHSNEMMVTDLWNESVGYSINLKNKPNGIIRCFINKIPLNAGSYYFNIYCKSYNEVRYAIERACNIRVLPGDFFGSGILLEASAGVVLLQQEWNVE